MVSPTFGIDIEPDYIKTFYGKYRSLPLNTLAEAIKAWREGKGFVTRQRSPTRLSACSTSRPRTASTSSTRSR
jgi:hypothetical protein